MKKISIITTAALLLFTFLLSMESRAQFAFGVKAGLNSSQFDYGDKANNAYSKSHAGPVFGGFAIYQLAPALALQTELLFSQQGAKGKPISYDFDYIIHPLLARYTFAHRFYAVAGPQLGFLVAADTKAAGEEENIKDNVRKNDFSAVVGAGYEFKQGIIVDFRFIPGLTDISVNSAKIKNTVLQLTVGYRFGKRK